MNNQNQDENNNNINNNQGMNFMQEQPENPDNQDTFFNRISSKDFLVLTTDFFPSLFMLIFVSNALNTSSKFCDDNFPIIFKVMIFIYCAYLLKSMIMLLLIFFNANNADASKISLSTMKYLLIIAYYTAVVFAYYIYKNRPDECFMVNTFQVIILFCIVLTGLVSISRTALNILMIILCFPILVYYFLKNPQNFYTNFGIDPEVIRNLETIPAGPEHLTMCAICTEDITLGQQILMLKCHKEHFFHGDCIKGWLEKKLNCPICRSTDILM